MIPGIIGRTGSIGLIGFTGSGLGTGSGNGVTLPCAKIRDEENANIMEEKISFELSFGKNLIVCSPFEAPLWRSRVDSI